MLPVSVNTADFFAGSLDSRLIREDSGIEVLSSLELRESQDGRR